MLSAFTTKQKYYIDVLLIVDRTPISAHSIELAIMAIITLKRNILPLTFQNTMDA